MKNNKNKSSKNTGTGSPAVARDKKGKNIPIEWFLLCLLMAFIALVRLRLLEFPLERDEGEYAYMGSLILKGIMPYIEAYNMKFPGTYFSYAIVELLFGQSAWGIHMGLLIVNLASIWLLFRITENILGSKSYGILAATVFGLSSLSYSVLGFAAHATHFVVLAALGGIYLTQQALKNNSILAWVLAGATLGLAYVMKQSGLFLFPIGIGLIGLHYFQQKPIPWTLAIKNVLIFGFSGLIPFVLVIGILAAAGSLDKFYFWTFQYASSYGGQVPFSQAFEMFNMSFKGISDSYGWFWLLGIAGLVGLYFIPNFFWGAVTVSVFAIFSFLSVCPGFYFRQHYFIQYLPALGLTVAAAGYVLDYFVVKKANIVPLAALKYVVLILFAFLGISKESKYLFKEKPLKLSRIVYGSNPFPESIQLAEYLKNNTSETDKIAILGSEPQIFFYAGRKSATGYIYTYNLMEKHPYSLQMQKEMAAEVEKSAPKYLLFVNIPFSWLSRPDSEKFIFDWYGKYINDNYGMVGIMDIVGYTGNFVTENLSTYKPQSTDYILVFKRK